MADKTRVSRHSGRVGRAKHNDRNFNTEKADHIDQDRISDNVYWTCYDKQNAEEGITDVDFQRDELRYYMEHYQKALDAQNERHARSRHKNRIKSMWDVYNAEQTRPDETIFQIGNKDDMGGGVDKETLISIYNDYWEKVEKWNQEHGNHLHRLSVSVHADETTPHIHERVVWDVMTEDGLKLAQDKALEAAGIELPDPSKPKSRYNNRKMVVDAIFREFWVETCKEYGINVEERAVPGAKHKEKEQFIEEQIREKTNRLSSLEKEEEDMEEKIKESIRAAEEAKEQKERALAELAEMEANKREVMETLKRLRRKAKEEEAKAQRAYDAMVAIMRDAEWLNVHEELVQELRYTYPDIYEDLKAGFEERLISEDVLNGRRSTELEKTAKDITEGKNPDINDHYSIEK